MRFINRHAAFAITPDFSMGYAARRMTVNLAAALLVFTLLQLWATLAAIEHGAPRWLPLGGLALLVLGAIPFVRIREQRWSTMRFGTLPSPAVKNRFRRDLATVWMLATLVPPAWTLAVQLFVLR